MTANALSQDIVIMRSRPQDAPLLEACMAQVYGVTHQTDQVFSAAQFTQHMQVFPEGQFTAWDGDRVVGLTVSMRMPFDLANPPDEAWWTTINGGWLNHDPQGDWMYGVESCVLPEMQGHGVGGGLMRARFDVARMLNMRGMIAGSALVSYITYAEQYTPEAYVREVAAGRIFDNNLTKQVKKGFQPVKVIPNYVTDPTALGWGCWIVWHNPDYADGAPSGAIETLVYHLPKHHE
jgi:GNAT superfamily N-acetyltransferase